MRKRNVMFLADTIFWYLIYFLPVIMYGIYLIHGAESGTLLDFSTFIDSTIFADITTNNVIYVVVNDLFGTNGVVPLLQGFMPRFIVSYFSTMVIVHLCVDFILFIPRLCHKWLDMYTKGVEK